ncbi:MAG: FG-GAP-like repeat-containing protein, partial [Flavobacteriales bacterium]
MKRKLFSFVVPLLVMSFSFGQTMTLTSYQTGVASDITVNYTVSNATGVVGSQLWIPTATGTYQSLSSPELIVKVNGVTEVPVSGSASSFDWGGSFAVDFRFSSTIQVGDVIDIAVTGLMINPTSAGTQTGTFRTILSSGGPVETFTEVLNFTTPVLPPTITSFSPRRAEVGDAVTITGTNFSTTASDNIVYFGGVKASVTSATATQLVVTVPAHAMDRPISVTTNGFRDETNLSFIVENTMLSGFSLSNPFETAVSYSSVSNSTAGGWSDPTNDRLLAVGDLDLDGKPDVVKIGSTNQVGIYRNTTSTLGVIDANSFNTSFTPLTAANSSLYNVAVVDMNNDGKLDIVVSGTTVVSIFENTTSSPGTISFSPRYDITTNGWQMRIADIDKDGWNDIIAGGAYLTNRGIKIYRNTSSQTSFSFSSSYTLPTNSSSFYSRKLTIGDINMDGLIDVIGYADNYGGTNVFLNTSTSGTVSFNLPIEISGGSWSPIIGDIDNDGINDITGGNNLIITNVQGASSASDFTSTNISGDFFSFPELGDIDGDGFVDLITSEDGSSGSTDVRFNSGSNTFSGVSIFGALNSAPVLADFDGDGKKDLLLNSSSNSAFLVARNRIGEEPTIFINGSISAFQKCFGQASEAQPIFVSGARLQSNITLNGLTGIEYSLDSLNFSSTLTFTKNANDSVPATKVYVRMASSATSVTGTIDFTSTGATSQTAAVSGGNYATLAVSTANTNPLCFGGYASSVATVTGGSGSFSYQWLLNGVPIINDTLSSIDSLTVENIYAVEVTDSVCFNSLTSPNLVLSQPDSVKISAVVTDANCIASTDGSIDVTMSGGTSGNSFTYSWDNSATTEDLSSLIQGTYRVSVTESNGCAIYGDTSFTVGVTDVTAPMISGTRDTLFVDATGTVIGSVDTSNFSPVYSDNCGVDSVWMIVPSYTCISGSVKVSLIARDT